MTQDRTMAGAIEAWLRTNKKVRTLDNLALELGMAKSTLRNHVAANRFRRSEWEKIARLTELPADEATLMRDYGFDGDWVAETATRQRRGQSGDGPAGGLGSRHRWGGIDAIVRGFTDMGKEDLFVFTSLEVVPMEFKPEYRACQLAAIGALERGAVLLYIRPSQKIVDYFHEDWNVTQAQDEEGMKADFKYFVRALGGLKTTALVAQLHHPKHAPFWVPGCTFGWFLTKGGAGRHLTMRVPQTPSAEEVEVLAEGGIVHENFEDFVRIVLNSSKNSVLDYGTAARKAIESARATLQPRQLHATEPATSR